MGPLQVLIEHFSPSDWQMWQLQRKNEELQERLCETHRVLDHIMERYRLLQTKLTNIEHNLSTKQYVLIPKSELFKFRLSEQLETDRLQEKLNDRNKMLEFASELLDHQYIKRDEKISELKTENALLRETLLESQKARDLADRCRLPVVEVSEELPIVFNSSSNNNENDSLASGDCSVKNAQISNSYSAFNKGDTN